MAVPRIPYCNMHTFSECVRYASSCKLVNEKASFGSPACMYHTQHSIVAQTIGLVFVVVVLLFTHLGEETVVAGHKVLIVFVQRVEIISVDRIGPLWAPSSHHLH
jgi:hypothetical protein